MNIHHYKFLEVYEVSIIKRLSHGVKIKHIYFTTLDSATSHVKNINVNDVSHFKIKSVRAVTFDDLYIHILPEAVIFN